MADIFSKENPDPKVLAIIDAAMSNAENGHPWIKAYYRSRGLSIDPPDSVGFIKEQTHYADDGTKSKLPALVTTLDTSEGVTVGLQYIFLKPNGKGKANVNPNKKFSPVIYPGALKGASIQLRQPDNGILGVAEGVENAEAIYEATGMATWSCGSEGGLRTFQPPHGIDRITIWGDNDLNKVGQKAAAKLAVRMYEAGYPVAVLIPEEPDTDWLDVLNTQGESAINQAFANAVFYDPEVPDTPDPNVIFADILTPQQRQPAVLVKKGIKTAVNQSFKRIQSQNPVADLNKIHFVVPAGGKVCIATEELNPVTNRHEISLGGRSDLYLRYSNWLTDKDSTAAIDFLKSSERREYLGLVFAPGQNIVGYYNLFRGFSVDPISGDCTLFWQHLYVVICNGNRHHYRYIKKWLSHLVQKPAELPGVALVLLGLQGTGKSIFVDIVGQLLGQHYLVLTRMEQLTGRFCGHLMDLLLVCANEALWGGDKAGEGALKAMITDPTMSVEFKGKDIIQVNNYKRFIVTSNESWPVPMDMDDRRFFVLQVSDSKKENKVYFKALLDQMNNGGREALLYDLLNENLDGFDVRSKPFSQYGFDIKLRGANPIVRWWYERLHDGVSIPVGVGDQIGEGWNDAPSKEALHESFMAFCNLHKLRGMNRAVFGKELRKLMPGCVVSETRLYTFGPSPGDPTFPVEEYAIAHRTRFHQLPSLEECRKGFERYAKVGDEIWADAFTPEPHNYNVEDE